MTPNQILVGVGTFVLVSAFLVLLYITNRQRQQTAIRKALIEKFGSAQDLGAFLQSPSGQNFVADLFAGGQTPARSILGSIQNGAITLLLGLAFMVVGLYADRFFLAIGGLLGSIGVGFLVSGAITHHLSKKWGLLNQKLDADRHSVGE